jgi:hypothetical protein
MVHFKPIHYKKICFFCLKWSRLVDHSKNGPEVNAKRPFNNQTQKCLVIKWLQYLIIWFSNGHWTYSLLNFDFLFFVNRGSSRCCGRKCCQWGGCCYRSNWAPTNHDNWNQQTKQTKLCQWGKISLSIDCLTQQKERQFSHPTKLLITHTIQ